MGRIYFNQFYTSFVEHCLKVVLRQWHKTDLPKNWKRFTSHWLDNMLSEEDKEFVQFVFDKRFYNTTEGLNCYHPEEDYFLKRRRLHNIERDFAIAGGLIDESFNEHNLEVH